MSLGESLKSTLLESECQEVDIKRIPYMKEKLNIMHLHFQ